MTFLSPEKLHPATARQAQLMREGLQRAGSGGHDALAFIEVLTRPQQRPGIQRTIEEYAFVVGGLVRDVLWGTSPHRAKGALVRPSRDADIIHTQAPCAAFALGNALTADVCGSGGGHNGLASTLKDLNFGVCSYDSGPNNSRPGVDLVSTRSAVGAYEPRQWIEGAGLSKAWPLAFGTTDLREDASLRCAPLNAVYYDVKHQLFLDPTGQGYEDACRWHWRCGAEMVCRNHSYPHRFYHGVGALGCRTDAETRQNILACAKHFCHKDAQRWVKILASGLPKDCSAEQDVRQELNRWAAFFSSQGLGEMTRIGIEPFKEHVVQAMRVHRHDDQAV